MTPQPTRTPNAGIALLESALRDATRPPTKLPTDLPEGFEALFGKLYQNPVCGGCGEEIKGEPWSVRGHHRKFCAVCAHKATTAK